MTPENQTGSDAALEFAPDDDAPIRYMQRTRDWYLALGYGNAYRWAHYADVPFRPPEKPLSQSTIALITTAALRQPDQRNQRAGTAFSHSDAAAKFYAVYSGDTTQDYDVRISHVAIDRKHTSMEDRGAWFPLPALRACVKQGRIGALARRFHGAPTNRSQRHTLEVDCPEILARCREDEVDAAILVANCPICHQSLGLLARYLEQHGVSTVLMACAKDIVEHCGVPRMLFSDFPLGNAAGRPHDPASQALTLELALRVLESAPAARTTVQSPLRWSEAHDWKLDYCNAGRASAEELAGKRAEFDRGKAIAKDIRDSTTG